MSVERRFVDDLTAYRQHTVYCHVCRLAHDECLRFGRDYVGGCVDGEALLAQLLRAAYRARPKNSRAVTKVTAGKAYHWTQGNMTVHAMAITDNAKYLSPLALTYAQGFHDTAFVVDNVGVLRFVMITQLQEMP